MTRQNLSFRLNDQLEPETAYQLEVLGLETLEVDQTVGPVELKFTTGQPAVTVTDRFTQVKLFDLRGPTTVKLGPDGAIYASTFGGQLVRFRPGTDAGTVADTEVVIDDPGRHLIAFAFDPDDASTVWVSQWDADTFTPSMLSPRPTGP